MTSRRNFLAPLAFIGVLFVAIAAALYFYATPRPVWTTSSPRAQGDFEFLGVYRGVPKQYAKQGYVGEGSVYTGDLWAYFAVQNIGSADTLTCRIEGAGVATQEIQVQKPKPSLAFRGAAYMRAPMPAGYSPGLRNGRLVLVKKGRKVGVWELSGMPSPKAEIKSSESYRLEAKALGYRFQLRPPIRARAYNDSYGLPSWVNWTLDVLADPVSIDRRDSYSVDIKLTKTEWQTFTDGGHISYLLPSANAPISMSVASFQYDRADRIEVALTVKRYRVSKDTVVLKDAVFELDASQPGKQIGIEPAYRLIGCSNNQISVSKGLKIKVLPDSKTRESGASGLAVSLWCSRPLGFETTVQSPMSKASIRASSLRCSDNYSGSGYSVDMRFALPFKSGPKVVRLKEYRLDFIKKIFVSEKTVTLMGPVK